MPSLSNFYQLARNKLLSWGSRSVNLEQYTTSGAIQGHEGSIKATKLSPDRQSIATAGSDGGVRRVRFWSTSSGLMWKAHTDAEDVSWVAGFEFSQDSTLLAFGDIQGVNSHLGFENSNETSRS